MFFRRPTTVDLALALAYGLLASIVLSLTRFDSGVAFLWLGSALLIPAFARRPRRDWGTPILLCTVASFAATGVFGLGWTMAAPLALANMAEVYIGTSLLMRWRSHRVPLGSLPWIGRFIVSVGVIAPAVAATIAGLALLEQGRAFDKVFVNFFAGHALGNLTFIPLITLLFSSRFRSSVRSFSKRRWVELVLALGLVASVTALTFSTENVPLLFLPCGPIVIAIFRGRDIGAAASIVLLALIGGGLTIAGEGPIQMLDAPLGVRFQFFQFYLAAVVLTALPIAADLRNRGRLHRELRYSEERYRLLADHSSDIMMHIELDGTIRFTSPSIRQLGGFEPDEVIGRPATDLIFVDDVAAVREAHAAVIGARGETVSFDYRASTRDGRERWFETHSRAILDQAGDVESVLSVIRDVTDRKTVETQLREAALTDPLTGLPNRRAFWGRAERMLSNAEPHRTHCIAIVDIDFFKQVNDRHGHDGGDAVLRRFALQARESLRECDFLARFGGEEFALLLPDTSIQSALGVCERLRRDIADMGVPTPTGMIRVTISGGVAELTAEGLDAAIAVADKALYQAKAGGRDQLVLAA